MESEPPEHTYPERSWSIAISGQPAETSLGFTVNVTALLVPTLLTTVTPLTPTSQEAGEMDVTAGAVRCGAVRCGRA
jgi:hypothetical protein